MRNANLLTRRAKRNPTLEVQPMRARRTRPIRPAITAIELGDEREPPVLGCVEEYRHDARFASLGLPHLLVELETARESHATLNAPSGSEDPDYSTLTQCRR